MTEHNRVMQLYNDLSTQLSEDSEGHAWTHEEITAALTMIIEEYLSAKDVEEYLSGGKSNV